MKNEKTRIRIFLALAVLAVLLCAGYANSLKAPFQFDDVLRISLCREIRTLRMDELFHYWECRFLPTLTLALNYHLGGQDVRGYHVLNLLIHLLSSWSVFFLARATFSSPRLKFHYGANAVPLAFASALLFALHPVQTESVTYIYQRSEAMMGLFYLGALLAYAQFRKNFEEQKPALHPLWAYGVSFLCAVGASFSKPNAATLPLAILLYEKFFFSRKLQGARSVRGYLWAYWIPAISIYLMSAIDSNETRNAMSSTGEDVSIAWGASALPYYAAKAKALVIALRLLVLPVRQSIEYDLAAAPGVFDWSAAACALSLCALLTGAYLARKKAPLASFGVFFFFLSQSVMFFLRLRDVFFEHYLYLAVLGWALFLPAALDRIEKKLKLRHAAWIALAVLIAVYGLATFKRNEVWKSEISLWEDAVKKAPGKARPHYILGACYILQGRTDDAFREYKKALSIRPFYPEVHFRLGEYYASKKEPALALSSYNSAVLFDPRFFDAQLNLGELYFYLDRYDMAVRHLAAAAVSVKSGHERARFADVVKSLEKKSPGHLTKALLREADKLSR